MTTVPDHAFTHAGVFHADDVFSAALLTMLNPSITIQRGLVAPEDFEGIVFDVSGGEFDHHGECRRMRENGVPYAAFGLLWERYGSFLLAEEDAQAFDRSFVQPIDDADNGGAPCMVSQLVSDFNPVPQAKPEAFDVAFEKAVAWALSVLERRIGAIRYERSSMTYVKKRMKECDGQILVLDSLVPWKTAVVGSRYIYAVYPSARQGFNVQAVPTKENERSMVKPFPQAWRGKDRDCLRRMTGLPGFIFCHPSGFLCGTEDRESALCAAKMALLKE